MNQKLIGIIGGKGEMGQYFVRFFERNGYEVIVSDKRTKLSNEALAKKADVVIVSVPMGVAEEVIAEVAPAVKKSALLMDFTSLKSGPMEAMKKTKASYLGCHPLFGPTTSIEGQMVALCKGRGAQWYKWWKDLLLKNKVEVKELTARKHDELMGYIQALTHFSFLGLADTLRKSGFKLKDLLEYQSPVYRLRLNVLGRILNQDPNLYGQIQIQNPRSLRIMKEFIRESEAWVDLVERGDLKGFEKRFNEASRYFGTFKEQAAAESDFLIEQMNRRKLVRPAELKKTPDSACSIATLGPENSFSSLAAKKFVSGNSENQKIWYADTITEVFEVVKSGKINKGVVPIENSTTGTVAETQQALFESGLKISEEFSLPIHYSLAGLEKIPRSKIKVIYSHGQPLKQCRKYLKRHFPHAQLVALPSTTAALDKVVREQLFDAAAICSKEAAEDYRMELLADDIGDFKGNATRFLVVGKTETEPKKRKLRKTSIAFYFSSDAPGSLYQVLGEFNQAKVNMTRIESSANPSVPGGYVFFVDFQGSEKDPRIQKMLSCIRRHVKGLKRFGSY